jgi:kumamolisin
MIANSCINSWETITTDPAYTIPDYISGTQVSPPAIASAYNMPASGGENAKVGIISLGGGWLPSDLQSSMSDLGLSQPKITSVLVDGAGNVFSTSDSNSSNENTLDLYCVAGIVPRANIVLYTGLNSTSSFVNTLNRAVDENCDVISISWGIDEVYGAGDFLQAPLANAAAKGITILAASGDFGSEGSATPSVLTVNYPASSPNVVAVGGTILNITTHLETVSNSSGGGISTLFSVPSWQTGLSASLYFSANNYTQTSTISGRGVPDIAAPYQTYVLYYNGTISGAAGTSASTPIIAGMLARYISLTGRRPIANAIHPILYSNTNAYFDITTGNNNNPLTVGFLANTGWDPVVGMGSPKSNIVYQMVTSGGTHIKSATNTWTPIANVYVKTGATTWANVRAVWTKINSTTWKQTF